MKKTQKNDILTYLMGGHKISQAEAYSFFGCFRLAARVKDLRNEGHPITTDMVEKNGKWYAEYYMGAT